MNFTGSTCVQLISLCVVCVCHLIKIKNVLKIKEVVKYYSGIFDSDVVQYLKMGRPLPSLKEGPSVMLFYLLEIFQSN